MGSDIKHLKESFDEFKEDTKKFHEKQTEMLDELKAEWQKFGGLVQGVASIQAQVNEHDKFITEIKEHVRDMIEERKDTKRRIKDFVFKWGFNLLMFMVMLYLFFSLQLANKNLIQTLEKGIVIESIE